MGSRNQLLCPVTDVVERDADLKSLDRSSYSVQYLQSRAVLLIPGQLGICLVRFYKRIPYAGGGTAAEIHWAVGKSLFCAAIGPVCSCRYNHAQSYSVGYLENLENHIDH